MNAIAPIHPPRPPLVALIWFKNTLQLHPKKYSAYHVLLSYMKALHLMFMQELFKLCLREIVVAYAYSNNIGET